MESGIDERPRQERERRSGALALAALVVAAILAACGSESSSPAAAVGTPDNIAALVKAGADVEARGKDGRTIASG